MIQTEKLAIGYNNRIILDDITIEVNPGQVVTLIGPNGSGKSTLLKTIANQLSQINGNILVDDISISGNPLNAKDRQELAKKMALLFTERINPELMTCFDVVCTGRYPYTGKLGTLSDVDRDKVVSAMETVKISELAYNYFSEISDGQKQRVMLARAIAQDTEYLIMDEPTTFLDINYKLEFIDIVNNLKHKGVGIIMSIHELELARIISDSIVCINSSGNVDAVGLPDDIFSNDYIDGLFGMKPGSYAAYVGCGGR